jgi:hypothetical protein
LIMRSIQTLSCIPDWLLTTAKTSQEHADNLDKEG